MCQLAQARKLAANRLDGGRHDAAGSGFRAGRNLERGNAARFDEQRAGSDKRSDLGIAKFFEQAKEIVIDRLAPDVLSRVEIAADSDSVDPRVQMPA